MQCTNCGTTEVLVGEQIEKCKSFCYDCYKLYDKKRHESMSVNEKQKKSSNAWEKVS